MKILLFTILFSITVVVHAQAQSDVIINFKNKTIKLIPKDSLYEGATVRIKIEDLPSNSYRIIINKADSFINIGTPPALFSVFNFGDEFNNLLAGLTAYGVRNTGYLKVNTETMNKNVQRELLLSNPVSKGKLNNGDDFTSMVKQNICNDSDLNLMVKLKDMRKEIFDFHFKFRDEIIKEVENLFYRYNTADALSESFISDAEALIQRRFQFEKELERKYQSYYDDILPYYDVVTRCVPLATADSMIAAYKRGFPQILNAFDSAFNKVLLAKVYKQIATASSSTRFISLPYTLSGDITKFQVDISGIDASKTPQSYNTTIILNKHPNRLWSFTTGVFMSGLRNSDYSILTNVQPNSVSPAQRDTVYSILKEQGSSPSAGINALMHIGGYFGSKSDVGAFVTFGPGLTFEKSPQLRVMLGAGLIFGRSNKLALSVGWTGGPVKRLSSNYDLQSFYKPAPTDITKDQFKGSWFISIGYSLFGK